MVSNNNFKSRLNFTFILLEYIKYQVRIRYFQGLVCTIDAIGLIPVFRTLDVLTPVNLDADLGDEAVEAVRSLPNCNDLLVFPKALPFGTGDL